MSDDGGIDRFNRRMAAIPKAIREAVQPALLKQAEAMATTMRSLVPIDKGDLRDSIEVTAPGQSTPPYSQPGGMMTVPENAVAITVGNEDVRYGHLVEYGHAKGFNGSVVPPHPFFWPSVRMHNTKAKAALKRAISKAVRNNWGEGKS